ncbi:MAG: sigma 54-interacting transcriptional regulator [Myxococcota bacterium]|jgi:DNA-binding NtrC family response regulator|nr:sigma 54-interacting transcriptional regulator [Myxococcota bacterium]
MPVEGGALWTRTQHLLRRVSTTIERSRQMDELLDVVGELTGAEQTALVVDVHQRPPRVLGARGRHRDLLPNDRRAIELSIEAADLKLARVQVVASARSRLVLAPIRQGVGAAGRVIGVLTLTFASEVVLTEVILEWIEMAAMLAALVVGLREEVESANERVRASQVMSVGEVAPPTLDELLASDCMTNLRADIDAALLGDAPLLILGESGTGKTQLATAIAHASGRSPVVRAVLGASDDLNTITSELFGHERGAFSGAVAKRKGLVEYADGGTLVLDEILNLPPHAQQLLLDFTQFGTYRPLGYQGSEPKRSRVRLIAATNGNMAQAIRDTRFRQDLFFRLAAMRLDLPPLRSRRQDIPSLARSFFRRFDPVRAWGLSDVAQRLLTSSTLEWAGNVRQLEGVLRRARDRALASGLVGGELQVDHFADLERQVELERSLVPSEPPLVATAIDVNSPIESAWTQLVAQRNDLDAVERDLITRAIEDARGNLSQAARTLGISRTSMLSRMNTLGVSVPERARG